MNEMSAVDVVLSEGTSRLLLNIRILLFDD